MPWLTRLREFNPLFQLHWLLGISAGLVLVVVGVTGGLLSFQLDILAWLNADVVTDELAVDSDRLAPPELVAIYEQAHPDQTVTSLFWWQDRPYPVLIGTATGTGEARQTGRMILNPRTGAPMGLLRGQWTFGLIRQLHERLAAGRVGQVIVGLSTLALVVLSLSGLYLRWQRRPRQGWRWVWPRALGGKLAGEWHSVLGVWALIAYLLAALTGLYWSFDWYRDGARALFASASEAPHPTLDQAVAAPDLAQAWSRLAPQLADARRVFMRLPQAPDEPIEIRLVRRDALHEFADDELFVHPVSGAVIAREPFDDLALGDKLLDSLYALHMGAFFGLPGIVLMMIASLAMPVFFVTGWILYIRRRRMKRQAGHTPTLAPAAGGAEILVAYASQSGLAQRVATQSAHALQQAGRSVQLAALSALDADLGDHRRALFVVSTHGEGDAPVTARRFDRQFCSTAEPRLEHLDYALLALGDRAYGASYCAFGRRLDRTLRARGARPLLTPIEVDDANTVTLEHWHAALAHLFGIAALQAEPRFQCWRLRERRLLNPDSLGAPTAWLRLTAPEVEAAQWQAGDIAEIRPRHPRARVAQWLHAQGLDGRAMVVVHGDTAVLLEDALTDRQLPYAAGDAHEDLQAWFDTLPPLAARDYSIANANRDGAIELVVRLARHAEGTGIASGWLIEHALPDYRIDVRLRANPGFRADAASDSAPAILIGNGTGIAGLRAHLQARIQAGRHDNWLIFGERQRAVDFYFGDDIRAWHERGAIAHLDLAFSRDADDGRYVQQALAEQAERLRQWIADGAHVFVCGSHDGMAPGVTRVLVDTLGTATVERLNEDQRVRMDVY